MGMPSPDMILTSLTGVANDWRWLAVGWHLALGAAVGMLLGGWRPSVRGAGYLLTAPLLSVSGLAWLSGNRFNGVAFLVLAGLLMRAASRAPRAAIGFETDAWMVRGGVMVVFGAVYPHFLRADAPAAYLYASPFALLPCPTLSVVIGMTLMVADLRPRRWVVPLFVAGALYAAFGVFVLGVGLDWGLFIGTAFLGARFADDRLEWRSVRASRSERARALPGDDLIAEPLGTLTHAITIQAGRAAIWPWLAQMGAGSRAGWYSYDALDNGRRPSATRLVPELQSITIGTLFPALPDATDAFKVLDIEPDAWLILGWPMPAGAPAVTWAFVLERRPGNTTRLIVRARAGQTYRFHGLPRGVSMLLIRAVHFAMQRRQLLGIARRAESFVATVHTAPQVPAPEEQRI